MDKDMFDKMMNNMLPEMEKQAKAAKRKIFWLLVAGAVIWTAVGILIGKFLL